MNIPHPVSPPQITAVNKMPGGELAHLLAGLERQKEELGPIAYELIGLLHRLGVQSPSQAAGLPVTSSDE